MKSGSVGGRRYRVDGATDNCKSFKSLRYKGFFGVGCGPAAHCSHSELTCSGGVTHSRSWLPLSRGPVDPISIAVIAAKATRECARFPYGVTLVLLADGTPVGYRSESFEARWCGRQLTAQRCAILSGEAGGAKPAALERWSATAPERRQGTRWPRDARRLVAGPKDRKPTSRRGNAHKRGIVGATRIAFTVRVNADRELSFGVHPIRH